jgi:hypothetical protein
MNEKSRTDLYRDKAVEDVRLLRFLVVLCLDALCQCSPHPRCTCNNALDDAVVCKSDSQVHEHESSTGRRRITFAIVCSCISSHLIEGFVSYHPRERCSEGNTGQRGVICAMVGLCKMTRKHHEAECSSRCTILRSTAKKGI